MSDVDQRVTVCSSATEHGFVCLCVCLCMCVCVLGIIWMCM